MELGWKGTTKGAFAVGFLRRRGAALLFSLHGWRLTMGMVRESQGTRGFLEGKVVQVTVSLCMTKPYMLPGFLKARGCMLRMLSPLSQVTLAKLAFLSSSSCSTVKAAGLAECS